MENLEQQEKEQKHNVIEQVKGKSKGLPIPAMIGLALLVLVLLVVVIMPLLIITSPFIFLYFMRSRKLKHKEVMAKMNKPKGQALSHMQKVNERYNNLSA